MEKDEKEELKSRPASRVSDAGKQEEPEEEVLSTEVTDEDLADAVEDEFGAKYSKDGKRLLLLKEDRLSSLSKVRSEVETYEIREGTRVICDSTSVFNYSRFRSVVIPSSVTRIGKNPFVGFECDIESHSPHFKVKDSVLYDSDMSVLIACLSKQTTFSIPSSVTRIGDSAFEECKSLRSVAISSSVTDIGNHAFYRCESLQSVVIPSSVTRIGDEAFRGCGFLQSVSIPSSVTDIGKNPFVNCECDIESHSPHFTVKDNVLYKSDMSVLIACLSKQTTFSIPSSVTRIGDSAFYGCSSLQSVAIPLSVTRIGDSAFEWCSSLESVVIPSSVTQIGDSAFSWCGKLESIVIPSSVTRIGDHAFEWCQSLQSVAIPSSVTQIGNSAFALCLSLQYVVIPSSVTRIGDGAFFRCQSLQFVVIPSSVTQIGNSVFEECDSLQLIRIPKGSRVKFEKMLWSYNNIDELLVEI